MSVPISFCDRARFAAKLLLLVITGVLAIDPASAQNPPAITTRHQRLTLPLTKFYDTPHPLPPGKPGELIRAEPFDDYYLPVDFTATRILYRSLSPRGDGVAVSGVVLVPDGTPPAGGWPVIAWAHDFVGAARQCAPSLWRNLYYGPLLSMYLNLGYAVVASDYAGLGTDFRSAVMDVQSHAADVMFAIPAARLAVPQLSRRWVVMGSFLGANAAISVAEMKGGDRDADYLGSVAISAVPDLEAHYEQMAHGQSAGALPFLAYGIKTVYPNFEVNDMLTAKALPLYDKINEGCGDLTGSSAIPASEMLKPNWKSNTFVQEFFSRNKVGQKTANAPLLVIGDDRDPAAPAGMTTQLVTRLCQHGDRVQFDKISDPESDLLVGDSVRDQMSWIEARFAGRTAPNNCH